MTVTSRMDQASPPHVSPQVNTSESPLMRLYMRRDPCGKRLLDAEQFAAGERLRSEFEQSMMSPRITMAYRQPVSSSGSAISDNYISNLSDSALIMRDNVNAAFAEVGPELSGILWNVVCLASGLEHAERVLALPVRSGKVVLALALDRLARHYGLKARMKPRDRDIGAWHTEDFRPVIRVPAPPSHPT